MGKKTKQKRGMVRKQADSKKKSKAPRFYAATRIPKRLPRNKTQNKTMLRESITPGTILIVLNGPYQGKRVVFLKQLESGLLLVSGPYAINGVPLRRLNQRSVIATSMKIGDISKANFSGVSDALFQKEKKKADKKKSGEAFFKEEEGEKKKKTAKVSDEFKALQKKVDKQLTDAMPKSEPLLVSYLRAKFSLRNGQMPHLMKF